MTARANTAEEQLIASSSSFAAELEAMQARVDELESALAERDSRDVASTRMAHNAAMHNADDVARRVRGETAQESRPQLRPPPESTYSSRFPPAERPAAPAPSRLHAPTVPPSRALPPRAPPPAFVVPPEEDDSLQADMRNIDELLKSMNLSGR